MVRWALLLVLPAATLTAQLGDSPSRRRYFVLRHGRSLANEAGVISSDPLRATHEHGLSEIGKEQAAAAGRELVAKAFERADGARVAIFSSDYARARETAEAAHAACVECGVDVWPADGPSLELALRERWFGEFDAGPDSNYERVWVEDVKDATHTCHGVESVQAVVERTGALLTRIQTQIAALEEEEDGNGELLVVLVAHGDVLQILQAAHAERIEPRLHRSLEHLPTATLREVAI